VLHVSMHVSGPSGETLFFNQQAFPVLPRPDPSLPARFQAAVAMPFTAVSEGTYTLSLTLKVHEAQYEWHRRLKVIIAPAASTT